MRNQILMIGLTLAVLCPPGALAQEGDWNVTESVAEVIIKSRDLNGDKELSFDEFWAYLSK